MAVQHRGGLSSTVGPLFLILLLLERCAGSPYEAMVWDSWVRYDSQSGRVDSFSWYEIYIYIYIHTIDRKIHWHHIYIHI